MMLEFQLFYFYIVNKGTLVYQVDWFKDVYLRSIANGNKMQSKKTKALVCVWKWASVWFKAKIICSEFILSSLITASPRGFFWRRHWKSEAVEDTHLPLLPALPQECFSSAPLSPMCRSPLCRVCFACKAGCRCCPQKRTRRDKRDRDTRRPHCHATRLASLRLALLPPPPRLSSHDISHYSAPSQLHPQFDMPPFIHPLRVSLCHPLSTRSCASPGKQALLGVWTPTHMHKYIHHSTYTDRKSREKGETRQKESDHL